MASGISDEFCTTIWSISAPPGTDKSNIAKMIQGADLYTYFKNCLLRKYVDDEGVIFYR